MVNWGAPPSRAHLGKAIVKPLTEEELEKKREADARQARVDALVTYEEKIDAIKKIESELENAKQAAMLASPAMFAANSAGSPFWAASPALGLGAYGGVHGLAQQGGEDLRATHSRLLDWLEQQNHRREAMSSERYDYITKYRDLEAYLRAVMEQNSRLERQNEALTNTIRQQQSDDFGRHPWDEQDRQHHHAQQGHHPRDDRPPPPHRHTSHIPLHHSHGHGHDHGHTSVSTHRHDYHNHHHRPAEACCDGYFSDDERAWRGRRYDCCPDERHSHAPVRERREEQYNGTMSPAFAAARAVDAAATRPHRYSSMPYSAQEMDRARGGGGYYGGPQADVNLFTPRYH